MNPVDPTSLSYLSSEVLRQGIQFLYAQAGEMLRRWRERRNGDDVDATVSLDPETAGGLQSPPDSLTIHFDALEKLEADIRALRSALGEYAEGIELVTVDDSDSSVLEATDALRRALEAVVGQRLDFRGEDRSSPREDVQVEIDVDDVAGYVAGVRGDVLVDGQLRASIRARTVRAGGRVVGWEKP